MLKMNRDVYMDKLRACFIGKNIGGTLGAPFEGKQQLLHIEGFTTPSGEPLPNDDLDLQLVWLSALERRGVANVDCNVLADYWLEWIAPHWNEYGICKTNLRLGLLPPMSGELDNEKWRTSNGAWIRSELWAGLAPGVTDVAIKYAVADAMVDHGLGEGTYAEVFTVTLQSTAYREGNIRVLLETALSKIPADCKVAQTVRLVMDCYDQGVPYGEVRERVVAFNRELGWFQAPGNLGFVAIGLLYGEGDFKKSVLYAVNCGDDTDCTAATVAATLGIIGGTAAIPADWMQFVGDRIVTICINAMYTHRAPKTCSELAARIAALVPEVMKANKVDFALVEGEDEYPEALVEKYCSETPDKYFARSRYSYEISHYALVKTRVELDGTPRVVAGDKRRVKLTFICHKDTRETRRLSLRLYLPDGWRAGEHQKNLLLEYPQPIHGLMGEVSTCFELTVGEQVAPVNRAYVEVTCDTLAYPMMIPIVLVG